MIDARLRRMLDRPLTAIARSLDVPWISPDRLTITGLVVGVASAVAAGLQWWAVALVLWLVSRVIDGLDGALARRRRSTTSAGPVAGSTASSTVSPTESPTVARPTATSSVARPIASEAGGYLDIVCDFIVYGATVVGVGVGVTNGFAAPWWPFVLVLLAYYVNGAAFLAFSSIAERTGRTLDDGRSLSFLGRIAEGTETMVVHSLWLIVPSFAWQLAVLWAGFVAVSATQRIVVGYRALQ